MFLSHKEMYMYLCGIIKPHAISQYREIAGALGDASVDILEAKLLRFTNELVGILYDHMSPEARHAIARDLISQEGVALLLSAPSIDWLLEIAGRESDPSACAPHTIRARFGVHGNPLSVGNEPWWQNAFHRPIDEREVARDLLHIFGLH